MKIPIYHKFYMDIPVDDRPPVGSIFICEESKAKYPHMGTENGENPLVVCSMHEVPVLKMKYTIKYAVFPWIGTAIMFAEALTEKIKQYGSIDKMFEVIFSEELGIRDKL